MIYRAASSLVLILIAFVLSCAGIVVLFPQFGFVLWGLFLVYPVVSTWIIRRGLSRQSTWPPFAVKGIVLIAILIVFVLVGISRWGASNLEIFRVQSIIAALLVTLWVVIWLGSAMIRRVLYLAWAIFVISVGTSDFICLANIQAMIGDLSFPLDLTLLNVIIFSLTPLAYWAHQVIFMKYSKPV